MNRWIGLDFRVHNLPAGTWAAVRDELAAALGDDYDVGLEADHMHCEFQAKAPLSG